MTHQETSRGSPLSGLAPGGQNSQWLLTKNAKIKSLEKIANHTTIFYSIQYLLSHTISSIPYNYLLFHTVSSIPYSIFYPVQYLLSHTVSSIPYSIFYVAHTCNRWVVLDVNEKHTVKNVVCLCAHSCVVTTILISIWELRPSQNCKESSRKRVKKTTVQVSTMLARSIVVQFSHSQPSDYGLHLS